MMEAFAKRYCDQNPGMFTSTGELAAIGKISKVNLISIVAVITTPFHFNQQIPAMF